MATTRRLPASPFVLGIGVVLATALALADDAGYVVPECHGTDEGRACRLPDGRVGVCVVTARGHSRTPPYAPRTWTACRPRP